MVACACSPKLKGVDTPVAPALTRTLFYYLPSQKLDSCNCTMQFSENRLFLSFSLKERSIIFKYVENLESAATLLHLPYQSQLSCQRAELAKEILHHRMKRPGLC